MIKKINAIKATHQPSPWAKDYGSFEIMAMTGTLKAAPEERSSAFNRDNEIIEAYHYKVEMDDYDTTFEVAPTLRCASFNITYPETEKAWLLFDKHGKGSATVDRGPSKGNRSGFEWQNQSGVYLFLCGF